MLTKTFVGLAGLSQGAEGTLWKSGILNWDQASRTDRLPFSEKKARELKREIRHARVALAAGLADWFFQRLPWAHKVRLLSNFANSAAFLDLETTGLSRNDRITTAALYLDGKMHLFVRGINLEEILSLLPMANVIVTFNGTRFDLPFLQRMFKLSLKAAHIDLMFALKAYGYQGGQKKIEHSLSIMRPAEIGEINGSDAVRLWQEYKAGNLGCLERLLFYNALDTWNLVLLAEKCFSFSVQQYPLKMELPQFRKPEISRVIDQLVL